MPHEFFVSSVLTKALSQQNKDASKGSASPAAAHESYTNGPLRPHIVEFSKKTRKDFLAMITVLDHAIDWLETNLERVKLVIAGMEEAGGYTVRAKNYLTDVTDITPFVGKLKEIENFYNAAIAKNDALINTPFAPSGLSDEGGATSSSLGNLLKGETMNVTLNPQDSAQYVIQGIDLRSATLGVRQPDFTHLAAAQNSRIDVANMIDIAVTLKNIIAADIMTLSTRREFCESAMASLTAIQDLLKSGQGISELSAIQQLAAAKLRDELLPLAFEPQSLILDQFTQLQSPLESEGE